MEFLAKKTSIKMTNKLSGSKKKKNKAIKGPWKKSINTNFSEKP